MAHLSRILKSYILNMRLGFDLLFLKKKSQSPTPIEVHHNTAEVPTEDFDSLIRFLTSDIRLSKPAVYSSDNSLRSCYSYGDINDLIDLTEIVLEALMLDKLSDFDVWFNKRSPAYVRDVFIPKHGSFPDVEAKLLELRWVTLRLAHGYNLRRQHPDSGVFVKKNLGPALQVLEDLDVFFKEIYREYREPGSRYPTSENRWRG